MSYRQHGNTVTLKCDHPGCHASNTTPIGRTETFRDATQRLWRETPRWWATRDGQYCPAHQPS